MDYFLNNFRESPTGSRTLVTPPVDSDVDGLKDLRLLAGNSHPDLFERVAKYLKVKLTASQIDRFSNSEIRVRITENIRRKTVIIFQTGANTPETGYSVNDYLMETLLMVNACRLSSVDQILLVMPCYPYARQDKKDISRTPISGKLVADMLQSAGVNRLVTMDLHASQIAGFFSIPVDNLYSINLLANYLCARFKLNERAANDNDDSEDSSEDSSENSANAANAGPNERAGPNDVSSETERELEPLDRNNLILVSPDNGGIKRMEALAQRTGLPTVTMHKVRDYINKNSVTRTALVGDASDVSGKSCLIIDDMCDTAGTMVQAGQTLMEFGARDIRIMVVHGILSGPALARINERDYIKEVIVTNTLPQEENLKHCSKLRVIDVSSLLGETARRLFTGGSISELFD